MSYLTFEGFEGLITLADHMLEDLTEDFYDRGIESFVFTLLSEVSFEQSAFVENLSLRGGFLSFFVGSVIFFSFLNSLKFRIVFQGIFLDSNENLSFLFLIVL